jgi:hypothetical protein
MKTILMTTFEVGRIASGFDMTCGTLDDERFNVRGPKLDDSAGDNPDHLRRVNLGYDQFRTVATGGTAYGILDFVEGDDYLIQVAVRLATLAEYREMLAIYRVWFEENGIPCPEAPTDEQILPLITPVVL